MIDPIASEKKQGRRQNTCLVTMGVLLLALCVLAVCVGAVSIPVFDVLGELAKDPAQRAAGHEMQLYVLTDVRLPRVLLCMLTGISLGLCGCIMQNVLRNPLASPFTLGVSSGASFGAAIAMILGVNILGKGFVVSGTSAVAVNAFLFGCLSLLIVMLVSRITQNNQNTVILTGVAINSLFSAGVSVLKYLSNTEALKNLDLWLMGGFWGANWRSIAVMTPVLLLCIVVMMARAWDFNAMNAGEEIAKTAGVNIRRVKNTSLILVTLAASVTIAFSGVIGFIGLVAPHMARRLVGTDNRRLIPGSMLLGAIILLLSDTVARTIVAPKEIPVGIITSILGVPFFIFILSRRNREALR